MKFRKIDLLIIGYAIMTFMNMIYLVITTRFDILILAGPLALIPLIIVMLKQRNLYDC